MPDYPKRLALGSRENVPLRASTDVRRGRILIVDDNDDVRCWIADELRLAGLDVATASTTRAALEVVRELQPHVIVCELILPDARPYHFVHASRALALQQVRFIGVTRAPAALFEQALRSGFDEVLPKPLDIAALLGCIHVETAAPKGRR